MKLIVGLGNPGRRYQNTRHNLGFMVIDQLAKKIGLEFAVRSRPEMELAKTAGLILVKPLSYMNESGRVVAAVAKKNRLKPEQVWVVSDDVDLALGAVRIRHTGSAGGHRGLASIIEHLGSPDFHRIRIGVGSNRAANLPAEEYVLQPFKANERPAINAAIDKAAAVLEHLAS